MRWDKIYKNVFVLPYIGNQTILNEKNKKYLKNLYHKVIYKQDCPRLYEIIAEFAIYKEVYPEPTIPDVANLNLDLHEITNLIYKDYLPERLQWVTSYNLLSYYVMKALCVLYFSKVGLQDIIINRTDYTISPNNIQILPLFDPRNYKFNTTETPYIPSLPDTIHYYDPTNEVNYEVFGSKFEDHRIMIELFRIYFGGLKSTDENLFNKPFKIPNLIKKFGLKWLD